MDSVRCKVVCFPARDVIATSWLPLLNGMTTHAHSGMYRSGEGYYQFPDEGPTTNPNVPEVYEEAVFTLYNPDGSYYGQAKLSDIFEAQPGGNYWLKEQYEYYFFHYDRENQRIQFCQKETSDFYCCHNGTR